MACYTQEEIAEAVGVDHKVISRFVKTVQGYQTYKTDENDDASGEGGESVGYSRRAISDLLDKILTFGGKPQVRLSAEIAENSQETDEPEDAPEDDNERIFDMWMAC